MNVNSVLVERLASALLRESRVIAIAESCTGGWIAKTLTDMPGSSAWFQYGFVTYGNNAKADLLQVDAGLIDHRHDNRGSQNHHRDTVEKAAQHDKE